MATTIDELQVIISANNAQFSQKLNETNNQVANLSKNISRSFRGVSAGAVMAGSVLSSVLSTAFRAVSASVDKAVERLDTLNNFPRVMSNLGISASESQKTIQYLSDKLVGLPTTINEAALSVQRLTSANGNIKASTAMFLAMNNAILAGGAPMDLQRSALEQLSQAYTKGVPDMMEWRTMMMAMPAQLKQVAMAMNLPSADQLGEALRNGQVSMNDFMATMVKLNNQGIAGFQSFADQAKNSTGGVATAIANLKTAIVRAVASIMDAIGQANISGFISTIANSINAVVPYIVGFTKVVMEAVGWVVGLFGGTIKTTKSIQTSAQSAGASVGKIANNAGNATKALGGAQKAAKKLKGTLASFDEMNVLEAPQAAAGGGKSGGGGAGGGAGGGGAKGASVAMPTVDYGNKLNDVAGKADAIAKKIKDFLQGAFNLDWNNIAQAFGKFWDDLKNAAEPVGKIIGDIWENYIKPLVTWTGNSLLPAVLNALGGAIRFVAAVLESAWTSFIKPFMDFFVVPIAKFAGSLLVDTLNAIGDGLRKLSGNKDVVTVIAGGVVALGAVTAGSSIIKWFSNAVSAIKAFSDGAASFNTLKSVIGGPLASIVKVFDPVIKGFKRANSAISDFLRSGVNSLASGLKNLVGFINSPADAITKLTTVFKNSLSGLGGIFSGAFNGIKSSVDTVVQGFMNIVTYGGATTNWIQGTALSAFDGFKTIIGALKDGISNLWGAFLANPLGAIIGLFSILMSTNDQFRDSVMTMLQTALAPLANIMNQVMGLIQPIVSILAQLLEICITPLTLALQVLTPIVEFIANVALAALQGAFQGIATIINSLVKPAIDAISGVIGAVAKAIGIDTDATSDNTDKKQKNSEATDAQKKALEAEKQQLDRNKDGVVDYSEALRGMNDAIAGADDAELHLLDAQEQQRQKSKQLEEVAKSLHMTTGQLKEQVEKNSYAHVYNQEVIDKMRRAVLEADKADRRVKAATDEVSEANEKAARAQTRAKDEYDDAGRKLVDLAKDTGTSSDEFKKQKEAVEKARDQFKDYGGAVKTLNDWVGEAERAGKNIGQGAINGLNAKKFGFIQANQGFARAGMDAFKRNYSIHSPSKVMARLGQFVGLGAIDGLRTQIKPFADVSARLADAGMDAFSRLDLSIPNVNGSVDTIKSAVSYANKNMAGINSDIISSIETSNKTDITVKIGEDTILDKIISGVNDRSFLGNQVVLNV